MHIVAVTRISGGSRGGKRCLRVYLVNLHKRYYRQYSNRTVGNEIISNLASARLDSKNFQKPNFFRWIRSTAVMEAHFPRKVLATHGGFFAPGSVACITKLP